MMNINEKMEDLKKKMNDISIDLVTDHAGYSSYICDAIAEEADSHTSIYYSDIKNFMIDNFDAVENAISEFGWDGCGSDLYKVGQMGEYLENERLMYEDLEEVKQLAALEMLAANHETIPAELWEEIETALETIDGDDRFDAIDDAVKEALENAESVEA